MLVKAELPWMDVLAVEGNPVSSASVVSRRRKE
jgi:hypothetical protein